MNTRYNNPLRMSGAVKLRMILLVLVPAIVILISGVIYLTGGRFVETENAYVQNDKVSIVPEISGNVAQLFVAENEPVKKGDILFDIVDAPYAIKVAQAKSQVAQVATEIETLKAQYAEQQEQLVLAQSNAAFAEREFARQQRLVKSDSVSESTLDKYRHQWRVAKENVKSVEQGLKRIAASLAGQPNINVKQHPRYLQAKAALDEAERNLEQTHVVAPMSGFASKTPSAGQYIDPRNPAMVVVATEAPWIEANLKETQLTHVKVGQKVVIHVDAYPDIVWHGKVKSIAAASGSEFALLPAQNSTGNWVKVVQRVPVRIAVVDTGGKPPLRAGMSTEISIDTGWHERGPQFLQPLAHWMQALSSDKPA